MCESAFLSPFFRKESCHSKFNYYGQEHQHFNYQVKAKQTMWKSKGFHPPSDSTEMPPATGLGDPNQYTPVAGWIYQLKACQQTRAVVCQPGSAAARYKLVQDSLTPKYIVISQQTCETTCVISRIVQSQQCYIFFYIFKLCTSNVQESTVDRWKEN